MYHYADGDVSRGPVSRETLRSVATPQTLVWREGLAQWVPAEALPELADLFAPAILQPQRSDRAGPIDLEPAPPTTPGEAPIAPYPLAAEPSPHAPGAHGAIPTATPTLNYGGYAPSANQAPGMAIASLVLGIVGLMTMCAWFVGVIPSVLAIIFGHVARAQGARGTNPGAGMALAGIIIGWIPIGLTLIGIVLLLLMMLVGALGA